MKRVARTVMFCALLAAACNGSGAGGGDGGGGAGGGGADAGGAAGGLVMINRDELVSAATVAEKGAICDWFASMTGGYGVMAACVYLPTWPDRATCVATFPSCAATIGQFQDCFVDLLPLVDGCTQGKIDNARIQPECMAAAPCFMMLLASAM